MKINRLPKLIRLPLYFAVSIVLVPLAFIAVVLDNLLYFLASTYGDMGDFLKYWYDTLVEIIKGK